MDAFLQQAEHLFEAAQAAADEPFSLAELAIVIGPGGSIRMMDGSGWRLGSLQAETGAQTVYRIQRRDGRVRIEGVRGGRTCWLDGETPAATARRLLSGPG